MNCVDARKHFADLLDHSRDERLRKVNDHLTACDRCTEELAAHAACQHLVAGLPPVEPPVGFTTRVMAEAREIAHRPSLWERLFSRIPKVPLQATAVVVIGILTVFIYRKELRQPEWIPTVPPASSLQKQDEADTPPIAGGTPAAELKVKESGEAGAQERRVKRLPQTEQSSSLAEPEEQSNIIGGVQPGARKVAPPSASINPTKVAPSKPKEESTPADETGSVRQEQSLRSGGAQAKGVPSSAPLRDHDTAARDRTSGGASASSAGPEEKRTGSSYDLSSGTSAFSDRKLILRLKPPARDDSSTEPLTELESPDSEASPSQTFKDLERGRQRAIRTGRPQTVAAIIDASHYDEFKEDLARLGKIESEAPAPANESDALSKSSGQLRLTITVLPPNSSAQPHSTR
jgi:hypothetical protein